MSKLITYDQCIELCNLPESPFYETKTMIDGFDVSTFNYRLAQWSDFAKPFGEESDITGYELRGLTFVFNKDGSLFKRYLLLKKFFNLNQVPETLYDRVKNFKIINVNNKEDGSLATFIKLPNGKVVGKSKVGFTNPHSEGINRVYNTNAKIRNFVNDCLDKDIVPIFEYVAPFNRIVLKYSKEELILLKLRDNKTGKYLDIKDVDIKKADFETHTLDDIIELSKTVENKEGWVIQMEDIDIKIKSEWYMRLHGLLTDDLYKENVLIKHILNDDIDDVISKIPEDEKDSIDRINALISVVRNEIKEKTEYYKNEFDKYKELSIKEYAIKYRKNNEDAHFILNMKNYEKAKKLSLEEVESKFESLEKYELYLESRNIYNMIIDDIKNKTKRLEMAREWLEKKNYNYTKYNIS